MVPTLPAHEILTLGMWGVTRHLKLFQNLATLLPGTTKACTKCLVMSWQAERALCSHMPYHPKFHVLSFIKGPSRWVYPPQQTDPTLPEPKTPRF